MLGSPGRVLGHVLVSRREGMRQMEQLTVTGLDEELSETLHALAKSEGISLNQAALKLLRKGAALADGKESAGTIGSSLDHLMGLWTDLEADEFDAALEDMESIDGSLWE